ncbi:MAG TPA: HDOD domain-containing protein, partial [bacterium]
SSSIIYHSPLEGYESKAGEMWDHSLRSAIAAREVARYAKKKVPGGLAFTAGLLHDIGKSIISEFLRGSTQQMTKLCESGQAVDYIQAERAIIGTDHATVGFSLAKNWGLPESLCLAIRDHHQPSLTKDEHRELVYAVHLGDLISMMGGAGTGSDSLAYKVDEGYKQCINVDRDRMPLVLLKVQEDFAILKNTILAK